MDYDLRDAKLNYFERDVGLKILEKVDRGLKEDIATGLYRVDVSFKLNQKDAWALCMLVRKLKANNKEYQLESLKIKKEWWTS